MSTGAECGFTELAPGKWEYRLQEWPYGDNDEFTTYGPFRSFKAADSHLRNNHANPGGYSTQCLPEGQHVHEWETKRGGYVPVGFNVEIRVESLGPDAKPADVIRHIQSLPPDSPAFRLRPVSGHKEDIVITSCEPCGKTQTKEVLNVR